MPSMKTNFREIRKGKKIRSEDVMGALGISQPTLSSWENGQRLPPMDKLCQLADFYGVTTDYLLGRPNLSPVAMDPVPPPALHGQPVWSWGHGWMLVNVLERRLEGLGGKSVPFSEAGELSMLPPAFSGTHAPLEPPLDMEQVRSSEKVWVEPLSGDPDFCRELRGWYRAMGDFVENGAGNRFFMDTYGAKWLAFDDVYSPE